VGLVMVKKSLPRNFLTMLSLVHLRTFFLHSFKIDFQCGSCPSPDVAFHFNPRFEEGGCVVCNTFESQNWGREERKYEMPFLKGHPFEIRVLVKHDSFQVIVNAVFYLQIHYKMAILLNQGTFSHLKSYIKTIPF
uniref:Galectin n=1 Tax=Terrapene triunguis TaxID=2587831 RepID=A0A674JL37_9SAUR